MLSAKDIARLPQACALAAGVFSYSLLAIASAERQREREREKAAEYRKPYRVCRENLNYLI